MTLIHGMRAGLHNSATVLLPCPDMPQQSTSVMSTTLDTMPSTRACLLAGRVQGQPRQLASMCGALGEPPPFCSSAAKPMAAIIYIVGLDTLTNSCVEAGPLAWSALLATKVQL